MRSVRAFVLRRLGSAGCVTAAVAGLAVVATAPAAVADAQILGAGSATAIDGSYVVVYKDSAAGEAKSAAASLGSKVTNTYSMVFPGFAAAMSEGEAKHRPVGRAVPGPGRVGRPVPAPRRQRDPRQECLEIHQYASPCHDRRTKEQVVRAFLLSQGYLPSALGECRGMASFGPGAIDACDGAPGERWHCRVRGGGEVSVFGCLCCNENGETSHEWRRPHWSINLSRRGGRR